MPDFRFFFENAPDPFVMHQLQPEPVEGFVAANRAALELFGYTEEEMARLAPRKLLGVQEGDRALHPDRPLLYRKELLRKDGTPIAADIHIRLVRSHEKTLALSVIRPAPAGENTAREADAGNAPYYTYRRNLATGRYDYMSPINQKLTGFSVEELSEMTLDDFRARIHCSDSERMRKELDRVLQPGEEAGLVEYRFRCRDGIFRWLSDRFFLMRDEKGNQAYLAGNIRDISRAKRMEEDLRKSEELYRAIVRRVSDGLMIIDLETRGITINDAGMKLLGVTEADISLLEMGLERRYPDGREVPEEEWPYRRASRGEKFEGVEIEITKKRSGRKWVGRFSSIPIPGASGHPSHVVLHVHDVTKARETLQKVEKEVADRTRELTETVGRLRSEMEQRLEAEKLLNVTMASLQRSESLLRTVLETMPVGVFVIGPDATIIYMNDAAKNLWGGEIGGDVRGDGKWSPRIEGPVMKEESPAMRALRTGEPVLGEIVEIENFDGRRRTIMVSAVPLHEEEGAIRGAILVNEDITEQQALQRQLLHAQKLDSVGQLAGGIAHDFNNILMGILGFAETAHETAGDAETEDSLEQVISAATRGRELTQKLLAFSRQQVIPLKATSLTDILSRTVSFLSRIIGEDIRVETELSRNQLTIMGDDGQLEQVLTNIILNARDAMPRGGEVRIRSSEFTVDSWEAARLGLESEGIYAVAEIADSGSGIDPQHLNRIFEPFFTTKEQGKGTGLGLAIAYGIARQHRGTITAESRLGSGSRFILYLPLVGGRLRKKPEKASISPERGSESVLVVEDEEPVSLYLKKLLTKRGYAVRTAANGEEALSLAEGTDVRLVISDIVMPKMNGMDLYQKLKEKMPDVKVILMSGYSSDIVTRTGFDEREVVFLQKPVPKDTLLKVMRELLGPETGRLGSTPHRNGRSSAPAATR